jgi:ubiquinone/menaquinone biosynthesis C-methylase UbiE
MGFPVAIFGATVAKQRNLEIGRWVQRRRFRACLGWPDGLERSDYARAMTRQYGEPTQRSRYSAETETAPATSSMELPTAREALLADARQYQRTHYAHITRVSGGELLLLNNGYEEDPPMALPLLASDEPDRLGLQLYHRTATQVDLASKHVLEVGCGHGGGASYLVRTLGPASYTGLDVNADGIAFCQERHHLPGLEFVPGDAENLPFPDQSFDAVINVESSHCYFDFPGFLAEVARVLRPGGHFLYADARHSYDIDDWQAALANGPLRMLSQRNISAEVARGLEKNLQHSIDAVVYKRIFPASAHGLVDNLVGANHASFCRDLLSGSISYWMYLFANS